MGLQDGTRPQYARTRAEQREVEKVLKSNERNKDRLDRTMQGLEEDLRKTKETTNQLVSRFKKEPLSATGIAFDDEDGTWSFKEFALGSGSVNCNAEFTCKSAAVSLDGACIVDGPRKFTVVAVASTEFSTYVAFSVEQSGEKGKQTKLITKSDPSRNRVFLVVNGKRHQALEGTLDGELLWPNGEIRIVAFPCPSIESRYAEVVFILGDQTAKTVVKFEDAFDLKPELGKFVREIEEYLNDLFEPLREQGNDLNDKLIAMTRSLTSRDASQ